MVKLTGFDALTRELQEAKKALASLDGQLGQVSFNPHDPASIEEAIQGMERMVDGRLGAYAANRLIGPLAEATKASYRQRIIDMAAAARLQKDQAD